MSILDNTRILLVEVFLSYHLLRSVDATVVFWRAEVAIGEPAPFQITAVAPNDISLSGLPVTAIRIQFEGEKSPPVIIEHIEGETEPTSVQRVVVGQITMQSEKDAEERVKADLRWPVAATKVFCGTFVSTSAVALKVRGQMRINPILGDRGKFGHR